MARKKQDPAIRKNEFIDAATKIFLTQGYEGTSVRDILKALGGESTTSPSVFYYYFKSKEELFDTCLSTYIDFYADDMVDFLKDDTLDYPAKMQKVIVRVKEALSAFKLMMPDDGNKHTSIVHYAFSQKFFSKLVPQLSKFISDGLESGTLPMTDFAKEADPQTIARLICSGIQNLFHIGSVTLPTSPHSFENVRLIPAYIAQILGLPVSMFEQTK